MFKRSLFLLSFLVLAPFGWGQVSEPFQFDLGWSDNADSIQAVLHDALAFSEEVYPESRDSARHEAQIIRRGRKLIFTDGRNQVVCEATTRGVAQVSSYRAEISLQDYSSVTPPRLDMGMARDGSSFRRTFFNILKRYFNSDQYEGSALTVEASELGGQDILLSDGVENEIALSQCDVRRPMGNKGVDEIFTVEFELRGKSVIPALESSGPPATLVALYQERVAREAAEEVLSRRFAERFVELVQENRRMGQRFRVRDLFRDVASEMNPTEYPYPDSERPNPLFSNEEELVRELRKNLGEEKLTVPRIADLVLRQMRQIRRGVK